jgi:hypothetical protein
LREQLGLDPEPPEKPQRTIQEMMKDLTGKDISLCPVCGKKTLVSMAALPGFRRIMDKKRMAFAFG